MTKSSDSPYDRFRALLKRIVSVSKDDVAFIRRAFDAKRLEPLTRVLFGMSNALAASFGTPPLADLEGVPLAAADAGGVERQWQSQQTSKPGTPIRAFLLSR